jgi:EF hand
MTLKTAIAIALATAFAVPLAASAQADKPKDNSSATHGNTSSTPIISGSNAPERPAATPKAEGGAGSGATGKSSFEALDKNHDGYLSRDETRDASWANRFSELDKDNDGRLSQSEFDAMQAGAGASGKTETPTSATNTAGRKANQPKQ